MNPGAMPKQARIARALLLAIATLVFAWAAFHTLFPLPRLLSLGMSNGLAFTLATFSGVALVAGVYLAPAILAAMLRHRHALWILAVNIFLGWLIVPWFIALIWAALALRRAPAAGASEPARREEPIPDEAAINWPKGPQLVRPWAVVVVLWLPGILPVGALCYSLLLEPSPVLIGVVAVCLVGLGIYISLGAGAGFAITDDGIFAFKHGKPWRAIPWHEVASITWSYYNVKGGAFHELAIKGPQFVLAIDSAVFGDDGYDEARRLLTRYAGDHGVRLREKGAWTTSDLLHRR